MSSRRFEAGNRVRVVGTHPFRGHRGTVIELVSGDPLWLIWSVKLDEEQGMRVVCAAVDLELLS